MQTFYQRFYKAVAFSQANALYCERLYGKNLHQHGFAEMSHLNDLIQVVGLAPGMRALDVGCGSGMITEYLSDQSGARFTGVDFVPEAICMARERTADRRQRLDFQEMEISRLDFPAESFDAVICIDTLYFTQLAETLPLILQCLKPGGVMGIFWSQSCEPWVLLEEFDKNRVPSNFTELALGLKKLGLAYQTWDYSQADYEHARRKLAIAEALRSEFEQEGNLFLYEDHVMEARGVMRAYEAGAHGRYLYRVLNPPRQ